jgi:hypothetical protein
LVDLLKNEPTLTKEKVLIFTEYMATARYLADQLRLAGFTQLDEIDISYKGDRGDVIRQFSPYYNGSSSSKIVSSGRKETRILVSTDILSEGLNLQDCTRLINYDIHWNPVRLMQRIGRVDRRLNPDVEEALLADHLDQKQIRGRIIFWNFLPPLELDRLLRLYGRVAHKTLQISKVFGIEGRKLLKPEDEYEALKDFTQTYEGTPSPIEEMHLEYQKLLNEDPELLSRLDEFPNRVFSGKAHPSPGTTSIFFCYSLPISVSDPSGQVARDGSSKPWAETGYTAWYLFNLEDERILENAAAIIKVIRSTPQTPRQHLIADQTLSEIRSKTEKYIKNTYLKRIQAPINVKPILKAWIELS